MPNRPGTAPYLPGSAPLPDPVGVLEISERLGVKQRTVSMWKYRELLPEPRWTVSGMPAWEWRDIERWARKTDRP